MATTTIPQTKVPQLNMLQLLGIGAAVIGLALLAVGFLVNPLQFAESYIFGFYFTMAFPLGCLGFLMVQHLTGGAWGVMVRRMLESGALALPIFFILSLPVVLIAYNKSLSLPEFIYDWGNPALVTPGSPEFDPIIAHKAPWMSPTWFAGRIGIYFFIWSVIAILLRTWSLGQDRGGDPIAAAARMRMLSGIGVALFVISVTFFAFDVGMSLDAHWYSTMYGAHYMENTGLSTLAFLILALTQVRHTRVFQEHVPIKPIHDIGKLMLGFTLLWAYLSYGQFVIIWSGDLAESVPWFITRISNGWLAIAITLIFCAFWAPFLALLGRKPKQNLSYLAIVATWVLVLRFIDTSWIILPEFHPNSALEAYTTFTNYAAPLGLFGIFLAIWAFNMQRAPLLPLNDPNMEILHAGGHH